MAAAVGLSEASVRRIFHAHGLKTSYAADLQGESGSQVLEDIVGLYLNPPEHSVRVVYHFIGWRARRLKDVHIIIRLD